MNQETELLEALDDWGADFKKKCHPVALTLFRAATVIRKQLAAEGGTEGRCAISPPSCPGSDQYSYQREYLAHCLADELENGDARKGAGRNPGSCDWEQNEDGWWNTDCNNAFQFTDSGPIYNALKFCPYCGKTLTETPYDDEQSSI